MEQQAKGEIAWIAIGANLGQPREQVARAMAALARWSLTPARCSRIWLSAPLDMPVDAPDFANAVIRIDTGLAPKALLTALQQLERAAGRPTDHGHNTPRHLDLDIICYGDLELASEELHLPHPRAAERQFVLLPMLDITANFRLPGMTEDIRALSQALPLDGIAPWPDD